MIDVAALRSSPLDPVVAAELDRFEEAVGQYLAGEIDDEAFRVFRLNQGIYGQRQGGHNQMVRVKVPHGRVTPDQLDMFGHIADEYSRGWGHLTTRQNVQFHFVQLERVGAASARPRRRRADQPRGVRRHGAQRRRLSPRRGLPVRGARHHAVGEGHDRAVPAQPDRAAAAPQVQDQLLGVRHRLRPGDVQRRGGDRRDPPAPRRDGRARASGCSSPAGSAPTRTRRRPSRSSRAARTCCPRSRRSCGSRTTTATVTTLRARTKWLVDTMGVEELRERIVKERRFLIVVATYPAGCPPR